MAGGRRITDLNLGMKTGLIVGCLTLIALIGVSSELLTTLQRHSRLAVLSEANAAGDHLLRAAAEQARERGFTSSVLANPADTRSSGAVRSMQQGTEEVERGIALADKASQSLGEIVNVSQRVTDMVTMIAAASEQQSTTSEQITRNVEAISKVTGETAQGTQQIAVTAEDLNRLTEDLQSLVDHFTFSEEEQVRSEPPGARSIMNMHRQTAMAEG